MHTSRYKRWIGQGSGAVLDQALYSGAHFLTHVLLARWMSPAEYGTFAVSFSIFTLMGVVYSALMIEPMLVLRSAGSSSGGNMKKHLYITAALALMGALLALIQVIDRPSSNSASALLILSVCVPAIFWMWFKRRIFYVGGRPFDAAAGGAVYFVSILAGAAALRVLGLLESENVWALIALASVLTIGFYGWKAQATRLIPGAEPHRRAEEIGKKLGLVYLVSAILNWIPSNIYLLALSRTHGMDAAAEYRALFNLILPATQCVTAIQMLLLPKISGRSENHHSDLIKNDLVRVYGLLLIALALILVPMVVFGPELIRHLYVEKYVYRQTTILMIGCYVIITSAIAVMKSFLKSYRQNRSMIASEAVNALAATALALAVVMPSGSIDQTVMCMIGGSAIALTLTGYFYAKVTIAASRV